MAYEQEFKRSEGLARKVLEILIEDYSNPDGTRCTLCQKDYLSLIGWTIEDYENCGYRVKDYKTYLNILKIQYERREDHPGWLN